jgi:hypothetical protein
MQLIGHKTRSVFKRYNIVSEGDLLDPGRRLSTATAHLSNERQGSGGLFLRNCHTEASDKD